MLEQHCVEYFCSLGYLMMWNHLKLTVFLCLLAKWYGFSPLRSIMRWFVCVCVWRAWWILIWFTHNTNYTATYLNLVPSSIRLCDKLGNYNNGLAPRPWSHTALRPSASSSFSLFILLSALIVWPFSFTLCSAKTMQLLTSQQHLWEDDCHSVCLPVSASNSSLRSVHGSVKTLSLPFSL